MYNTEMADEMTKSGFWPEKDEKGRTGLATPLENLLINPDFFEKFGLKHGEIRGLDARNMVLVFWDD